MTSNQVDLMRRKKKSKKNSRRTSSGSPRLGLPDIVCQGECVEPLGGAPKAVTLSSMSIRQSVCLSFFLVSVFHTRRVEMEINQNTQSIFQLDGRTAPCLRRWRLGHSHGNGNELGHCFMLEWSLERRSWSIARMLNEWHRIGLKSDMDPILRLSEIVDFDNYRSIAKLIADNIPSMATRWFDWLQVNFWLFLTLSV